jgi:hypothetical protein
VNPFTAEQAEKFLALTGQPYEGEIIATPPALVVMTTTETPLGSKSPATPWKGWHYTAEWFPAGEHVILEGMARGQLADVYARHTLTFGLDGDLYKPEARAAWESSATGTYLTGIEPYVRRGGEGSQRYLVAMTAVQAADWWPVAGKMPWGEIRSAGVGPSPGARHPGGDAYEATEGPDAVRYPDGTVLHSNVVWFDAGLKAALIADGAHGADDEPAGGRGQLDVPDDGVTICSMAAHWLTEQDFTDAPRAAPAPTRP